MLRERGYGGTGTYRTNAGVLAELISMKASDTNDIIPWGTIKSLPTEDGRVCQTAWKDNACVLMMSNTLSGNDLISRLRNRPKETSSKAKTAQIPFGNLAQKELEIPVLFDKYNLNMGAVDEHNNMASRNAGLRPIQRGGHQAIEHWLLQVVLVNCYLLALLGGEDNEREISFRSQKDFQEQQLAEALLYCGTKGQIVPKSTVSHISTNAESLPFKDHELVKLSVRKRCVCCAGLQAGDRPQKQVTLAQIAINSKQENRRTDTIYSCKQCDIAICKKNRCCEIFHYL